MRRKKRGPLVVWITAWQFVPAVVTVSEAVVQLAVFRLVLCWWRSGGRGRTNIATSFRRVFCRQMSARYSPGPFLEPLRQPERNGASDGAPVDVEEQRIRLEARRGLRNRMLTPDARQGRGLKSKITLCF